MKRPMRLRTKILLALPLLALLLIAGAVAFISRGDQAWRLQAVMLKVRGDFGDLTWGELGRIAVPGSGFWLEGLDRYSNPQVSIKVPDQAVAELEAGGSLFRSHCGGCHGADGTGTGRGPALAGVPLARAHTDWATYRIIERGIAGTAMPAHALPWKDLWLLTAYVESIKGSAAEAAADFADFAGISNPDLVNAAQHPENWLTYSGSYDGHRFSGLSTINATNVQGLQIAWIHHFRDLDRQQTVPLVANGIMYFTEVPGGVVAVNAATGRLLWRHRRTPAADVRPCCGIVNRGLAMLGRQLFVTTVDAHLVALDATTGAVNWDVTVGDYKKDITITSAPLVVNDLVVVGPSGGDFASRGFIAAYHIKDGSPAWRFETIAQPGAPGHDTWAGESWKLGGGAAWATGSFDPASNTIYWGVGNPAPDWNGAVRKGDNLYTNSVVAVDAASGTLKWHFQFTPHDTHDWDSAQTPVLVGGGGDADPRRLAWANRNGFFYSIDATSGKFISGKAFATQTWAKGLDASGRPEFIEGQEPSPAGTLVWPSAEGATNWWPPAFDRNLQQLYVPVLERPGIFFLGDPPKPVAGIHFLGSAVQGVEGKPYYTAIRALDPHTGDLRWEHRFADREVKRPEIGGLLATSGGLVFGSDQSRFLALDAKTGKLLWNFDVGAPIVAAPMTYAVNGRQMVAIAAGRVLLTFSLPVADR